PETELIIDELKRQVVLSQGGKLYLKINSDNDRPFKLFTPAGNVSVYGTEFSVSVQKENGKVNNAPFSVMIFVLNGTVKLETSKGQVVGVGGATLYGVEGVEPVSYW
ncbi:MAG TPA: hypothetical protein ENH82_15150, partial [bacterium]|nr:hypothetical protein [bacterium]